MKLGRFTSFANLALFTKIYPKKCYRFYWLNDLFNFPYNPLAWNIAATEGYPTPATFNFYSTSKWSPPCAHKNLNGFPLYLRAASLIVSRYLALSSGVQSSLWGKNDMIQRPTYLNIITFVFTILIKGLLWCDFYMLKMGRCWCLLSKPVSHTAFRSRSIIIDSWWVIFGSRWEKFDGWIAINSEFSCCLFTLSGINLCDFNLSFHSSSECCPLWSQSLTVTTLNNLQNIPKEHRIRQTMESYPYRHFPQNLNQLKQWRLFHHLNLILEILGIHVTHFLHYLQPSIQFCYRQSK